jgi:prepilin-type N-terminal cleavage/methylation domain-containing protein
MTRRRRSQHGFTLVEVLATLVLLGIVVPVAMRGVSVALAAAQTAKRDAEAASLAQSKLNEMLIDGTWQTSGSSGDFAPEHPEYHWTCENAGRNYGTNEVAIHVTWTQRGQERTLSLSTLVYPNAYTSSSAGTGTGTATGGGQ